MKFHAIVALKVLFLVASCSAGFSDDLDVRHISRTNNVLESGRNDVIVWYSGESVIYDVYPVRGVTAVPIPSNSIPIWHATDYTLTNPVIFKTGTVYETFVRFSLRPEESALDYSAKKLFESKVLLLQPQVGVTNRGIIDRTQIDTLWNGAYQGEFVTAVSATDVLAGIYGALNDFSAQYSAFVYSVVPDIAEAVVAVELADALADYLDVDQIFSLYVPRTNEHIAVVVGGGVTTNEDGTVTTYTLPDPVTQATDTTAVVVGGGVTTNQDGTVTTYTLPPPFEGTIATNFDGVITNNGYKFACWNTNGGWFVTTAGGLTNSGYGDLYIPPAGGNESRILFFSSWSPWGDPHLSFINLVTDTPTTEHFVVDSPIQIPALSIPGGDTGNYLCGDGSEKPFPELPLGGLIATNFDGFVTNGGYRFICWRTNAGYYLSTAGGLSNDVVGNLYIPIAGGDESRILYFSSWSPWGSPHKSSIRLITGSASTEYFRVDSPIAVPSLVIDGVSLTSTTMAEWSAGLLPSGAEGAVMYYTGGSWVLTTNLYWEDSTKTLYGGPTNGICGIRFQGTTNIAAVNVGSGGTNNWNYP